MAARIRGLILPAILVLAAFAVLISLGNWQMRRLAWKEGLIATVSDRPALPPLDWRDLGQRSLAQDPAFAERYSYRRIRFQGEYLPEKEVRVFTSLPAESAKGRSSGPGYWIMTPFRLGDAGHVVWVNRGFVPDGSQWSAPPAGEVAVTGLIRPDDPPRWLMPENKPERNLFFSRSVEVLSQAKELPRDMAAASFSVDLLPVPEGPALPQAGETRMVFTNKHLGYAFTWYGLAAALLAVFASLVWARLREGSQGAALTQPGRHP